MIRPRPMASATKGPRWPPFESGDAMCAVNSAYRIVGWNRAAEQFFGMQEHEALGRLCYETIGGRDTQGQPLCKRNCLPMQLATRGAPVGSFEMERTATGVEPPTLTCSTLTARVNGDPSAPVLLHIFRSNEERLRLRSLLVDLRGIVMPTPPEVQPSPPAGKPGSTLTGREREVLRHLRAGLSTREIASRLFISPLTVRNHIQNIFGKLQAHSRLQAVTVAERHGLL